MRTSWLYGGNHWSQESKEGIYKNFVNTILKLSQENDEIKVVDDQFGVPTSCYALSKAIGELIDRIDEFLDDDNRILHFANSTDQPISWFEFAQEILARTQSSTRVNPCTSNEYPTKAKRPTISLLINNSNIQLEDWRDSLNKYLLR